MCTDNYSIIRVLDKLQGVKFYCIRLIWSINKETVVQNCIIIEYKPHYGKLYLAQDGDNWRALLNAEMKLRIP
jgi:hypothetical protein